MRPEKLATHEPDQDIVTLSSQIGQISHIVSQRQRLGLLPDVNSDETAKNWPSQQEVLDLRKIKYI